MEADSEITPWTRICVSHADCILLVGAEDAVYPVCSVPFLSLTPSQKRLHNVDQEMKSAHILSWSNTMQAWCNALV